MIGHSLTRYFLICAIALTVAATSRAQRTVRYDETWWNSLDKNAHWDFIYGFTDCGIPIHSQLRINQYEDYVSAHINAERGSALKLIQLAPQKVKATPETLGGEVWKERHGFNDGDLWGDNANEGRVWVEGYLACEGRSVTVAAADKYVGLMLRHYANPKHHLDKLADVLEPLLPPKQSKTHP